MKTPAIASALLALGFGLLACDEHKYDAAIAEAGAAAASASAAAAAEQKAIASALASASAAAPPPAPHKTAADCKPHTVDFSDQPDLEKEIRRKLSKDTGTLAPSDLAQVKSLNLSSAKIHYVDPCIFPMLTSLKGAFLGPGDYDDLTPIQKLTTIEDLNVSMSKVSNLHAIEGLKRLDRLDVSHTRIDDEDVKSIGNLVNVTELTLDDNKITDLSPIAALTKLTLLSIKNTQVTSLQPLAGIKTLKKLYINGSNVTDITPVQTATQNGLKIFNN